MLRFTRGIKLHEAFCAGVLICLLRLLRISIIDPFEMAGPAPPLFSGDSFTRDALLALLTMMRGSYSDDRRLCGNPLMVTDVSYGILQTRRSQCA